MSRKRRSLEGQLSINFEPSTHSRPAMAETDNQFAFGPGLRAVRELEQRISEGDDSALVFPTASAKRIAIRQRDNYADYMTGARSKVVDSPKYRNLTVEELRELKDSGAIYRKLWAAHRNAEQKLRKTIAQNHRETDIADQSDFRGDKQSIEARLRAASIGGVLKHFDFASDMRGSSAEEYRAQLFDLASLIDKSQKDTDGPSLTATLDSALLADRGNSDAALFVYELGNLWVINTKAVHEHWDAALTSYNQQFPDSPIDPLHPNFRSSSK